MSRLLRDGAWPAEAVDQEVTREAAARARVLHLEGTSKELSKEHEDEGEDNPCKKTHDRGDTAKNQEDENTCPEPQSAQNTMRFSPAHARTEARPGAGVPIRIPVAD
eukprot:CAMPEP_0194547522 /NCGR_PEP_ID=MMETSP0253-20130528/92277_1 /TAXON_ID=2966 /ORGANISM="Noctiluca scintillans" /LENGTH=106 /DNA_ID=CAMNT_0039394737 /DNA_START=11 /DNA_END=331 /DNA_ORIENTATION=-